MAGTAATSAIARRIQSLAEETVVTSAAGTVPQLYLQAAIEVGTPATVGSTIRSIAVGLLTETGRPQTGLEERLGETR